MKTVEFFYDLSRPYSYLAATQLPRLAARTGASVVWRPMVLGAVFKSAGNTMPAAVPAKAAFMLQDLHRWARYYGVPFQFSSRFPVNAMSAMRLCVVADAQGLGATLGLAAFHALWVEDRDLTELGVLRALAAEVGLDPDASLAAITTPEVKDALRASTEEAVARGAFGAPALFVGDQLFWGNDRLHFVEAALMDTAADGAGADMAQPRR